MGLPVLTSLMQLSDASFSSCPDLQMLVQADMPGLRENDWADLL